MNTQKDIQDGLREINSNLPFEHEKPVFTVPEGYFENFAVSVLSKIKDETASTLLSELKELSPVLAGISRKMPFAVPENYFTGFADSAHAFTDALPETLSAIDKQLPYAAPDGYFTELPQQILSRIVAKPQARVISLNTRKWTQYAVAAMVAGILVLSSIFYLNKETVNPATASQEWVAKKLKNVSNQDLEEFIQTTDINKEVAQMTNGEVRQMLSDVSDRELETFLNSVPTDDEELSIIN